ncbi:MAG TPA: hypothetical protein VM865_01180 [Acidobacteriaceae bacterium]|nr:hypothetical protein [Acidobacteriaceae bacterium]
MSDLDKMFTDYEASERTEKEERERSLERLAETFGGVPRKIKVNKRTHRIRFESETETGVTIVIERRDGVDDKGV